MSRAHGALRDVVKSTSWRIDYHRDRTELVEAVRATLRDGPGFAVVAGVPLEGLDIEGASSLALNLVAPFGIPLLQGSEESPTFTWLVRDEGSSRYAADGSFNKGVYTSKSHDQHDLHNDGAMRPYGHEVDLFALLCVNSAVRGGESVFVNAHAVLGVLHDEFPHELERLCRPFAFERTHVSLAGQAPFSWAPVVDRKGERVRVRWNRQRIEMAPPVTGVPLSDDDVAALNAMDNVLSRPELKFRFTMGRGELVIVDDHQMLHGRTAFSDDPGTSAGRCVIRILLSSSGGRYSRAALPLVARGGTQ